MRTVQFELMRPGEFLEAKERLSVAYLPIGPLEWHGPHMPFGTDPLNAQAVARGTAERIGGVVFPTLYCGTEKARSPKVLRWMGFEDDSLYVVGMDVPSNPVKSCYFPEEIFGAILRANLEQLVKLEFRMIVIINGHGAAGQLETGNRLAKEFSSTTKSCVLFCRAMQRLNENDDQTGHANISETSMQMYLNGASVDLTKLPPRRMALKTSQWGLADGYLMTGERVNAEHVVERDPRDATAGLGRQYVENGIRRISEQVLEAYRLLQPEKKMPPV